MKSKILSVLSILALSCGFSACDDHHYGNEPTEEGSISFVEFGIDVNDNQSEIETRAGVDVSTFLVKIIDADKNATVRQSTYGELPGVISLPIGDYKIMVESHEVKSAEFDHPYYAGETTVKVSPNSITDAGKVICNFASIRVSVRYDSNLRPLLGDDVTVTVHANDEGELVFAHDETRSGYFRYLDGSTTLIANLKGTINGKYTEMRKEITDVKAGDHRIITYKVVLPPDFPSEEGSINPGEGVTIDSNVTVIDSDGNITIEEDNLGGSDRPGQEDPDPENPDNPDQPTPPADNDIDIDPAPGSDIVLDTPNVIADVTTAIVNINAKSGIKNLYLSVVSNNDEFTNIAIGLFGNGDFDMAQASGDSANTLRGFGLPCGEEVLNKPSVKFNISSFVSLLGGFTDTVDGGIPRHEFIFKVVSNAGNEQTKSLIFTAE